MQDNNRIDEQFIDHAWANMNKMLDQEMPIQGKKKRRFTLIWFLLPFLVIGSAVLYWQQLEKRKNVIPGYFEIPRRGHEPSTNASPIAQLDQESNPTTVNNEKPSAENIRVRAVGNIEQLGKGRELSIISKEDHLIQDENPTPEIVGIESIDLQEIIPNSTGIEVLDPISTLNLRPETIGMPMVLVENIEIISSKRKLDLGIELGTRTGNGVAFGGGYIGGFLDYKINNRWGISSGLALDWQRTTFDEKGTSFLESDFQGGLDLADTTDVETTTNAGNFDENQYEIKSVDVEFLANIFQLELPIKLTYQLSPNWTLMGGGYLNYVFVGYEEESAFADRQEIATGNASPLYLNQQSGIDKKILNRWNYGIEMGALYNINSQWQISMDASLGLKNWLNEGDNTMRNSVQVGLRYRFK